MNYRDYDTRLSAYAIVVDERQRALLALWNEGSRPEWTVPGGGVEPDETVEEAVVREVREETGYQIEPGSVLGIHSFWVPPGKRLTPTGRGLKVLRVIFDAVIVGGSLTNELDGSTDEARWIPVVEIPQLPHVDLVDIALEMRAKAR
jgi:8-oxo-dGTP diphosphatase